LENETVVKQEETKSVSLDSGTVDGEELLEFHASLTMSLYMANFMAVSAKVRVNDSKRKTNHFKT
jgi:hypothetical protein